MERQPRATIGSVADVQKAIPAVLREVNADPGLAVAALANPLLALEELGFEIDPAVRPELERRTRFDAARATELERLHRRVEEAAGHAVDIDSPQVLDELLFHELALDRPGTKGTVTDAVPVSAFGLSKTSDPLEGLRGVHPVMEPLLAYREIDASEPRLAPRELYDAIRRGERELPVRTTKITFRRKRAPAGRGTKKAT